MKIHCIIFLSLFITAPILISCKKLIQIPPPASTVTPPQVFTSDGQATSAAAGMYYNMINSYPAFSSGGMTIFSGLSSDELSFFYGTYPNFTQFQENLLFPDNLYISFGFWNPAFSTIYSANAILEGLAGYTGVHDSVKNELTGEAKFIRAFCNFYLVNLFGDIPLVTTTNWQKTNLLNRASKELVYQQIIADLKDAQNQLPDNYSVGGNQRIIPNKWAATALLARVHLFKGDWSSAENEASTLINNQNLFKLSNLNDVFLINSSEAIWQLQQDNNSGPQFNSTPEGNLLIPSFKNSVYQPFAYLTQQLLNSFEPADMRRTSWVDSTDYMGIEYYFPYKYKAGPDQSSAGGGYSEYYMVLRLGEQFLIRAEARAQLDESNALDDLNSIRNRAGLSNYSGPVDKTSILNAIYHERKIELFAEWGHRWLDLKRWGFASAADTLSFNKGIKVTQSSLLYPIPTGELAVDPNLNQNPGYH